MINVARCNGCGKSVGIDTARAVPEMRCPFCSAKLEVSTAAAAFESDWKPPVEITLPPAPRRRRADAAIIGMALAFIGALCLLLLKAGEPHHVAIKAQRTIAAPVERREPQPRVPGQQDSVPRSLRPDAIEAETAYREAMAAVSRVDSHADFYDESAQVRHTGGDLYVVLGGGRGSQARMRPFSYRATIQRRGDRFYCIALWIDGRESPAPYEYRFPGE